MRLVKIIILSTFLTACAQHTMPNSPRVEKSGDDSVVTQAKDTRTKDAKPAQPTSSPGKITSQDSQDKTGAEVEDEPAGKPAAQNSDESFTASQLERPRKIKGEKLVSQTKGAAVMIFLRSSVVASAVNAQVYDVSSGTPHMVGDIENNTRLHHTLSPGRHVFMLIADSVDYLVVEVTPGHTYYSVVKPSMGVWKPKFSFIPIKATNTAPPKPEQTDLPLHFGDEEVNTMLGAMTPIVYSKEFNRRKFDQADIEQRYKDSWQDWSSQQEDALQRKTLLQNDGRKVH